MTDSYNQVPAEDDFAAQLRARTSSNHRTAESVVRVTAPLALSSPQVYRLLLAAFYHVFRVLEYELDSRRLQYPKIRVIYFRQLLRTDKFERDLAYYFGPDFPSALPPPTRATKAYIEEMRCAADRDPVLLIAYSHSLYMALFGGGRIMSRWLRNAFSLTAPTGVAIFDFSDTISDVPKFRSSYYDAINRVALTPEQKEAIVAQKKLVFAANNSIFDELTASLPYRSRVVAIMARVVLVLFVVFLLVSYFVTGVFPLRSHMLSLSLT